MSLRILELGINALQKGSAAEGCRLIRVALKSDELTPEMRSAAYLWLAEAQTDLQQKRMYYSAAVRADPSNAEARARLQQLMTVQLPPALPGMGYTAQQPASAAGQQVNVAEYVARIIGGPNGPGTAFFCGEGGLLATTRYVIGGAERVTVDLHIGQQLNGTVVRSFPEMDIALVSVEYAPPGALPITPLPGVPDDVPLVVISYEGEMRQGKQRPTQRRMAGHWIPTTFTSLPDAGGDLLFDDRSSLVGMMTRNTSRASGHLYGVHIGAVRRCVEWYQREAAERRVYCPTCGAVSRAGAAGFFYCETCGGTLPAARHVTRYPVPQADAFYAPNAVRCTNPNCGALAPFYSGRCLRCGRPQASHA